MENRETKLQNRNLQKEEDSRQKKGNRTGRWKIMTPMLSAVVVAACAGVSLSSYTPAVYEVQARPVQIQEEAQEEAEDSADAGQNTETEVPEQETVEVSSVEEGGTYRDGTYYGSARGFAGKITVRVVIQGGRIASIEMVETSDDSPFIDRAAALISRMISGQTTNVDTVSGATYSSAGIINAVRNALSQAVVEGSEADRELQSVVAESAAGNDAGAANGMTSENAGNAIPSVSGNFPYPDGTYYGVGEGYISEIRVAVVIQNQTIQSITILEHMDDEAFFNCAIAVTGNVVTEQTINVDTVSGATYSSQGILDAVQAALDEAKAAADREASVNETQPGQDGEDTAPGQSDTIGGGGDSGEESAGEGGADQNAGLGEGDMLEEETAVLYRNGTYTVTVLCEPDEFEDFEAYSMTASITIQGDRIVEISNLSGDGDPSNDTYIKRAAEGTSRVEGMIARITALLRPDAAEEAADENYQEQIRSLDTVSRATCSSESMKKACIEALRQAGRVENEEISDQDM